MEKEKEIRKILKEMDDVYGHDFVYKENNTALDLSRISIVVN